MLAPRRCGGKVRGLAGLHSGFTVSWQDITLDRPKVGPEVPGSWEAGVANGPAVLSTCPKS